MSGLLRRIKRSRPAEAGEPTPEGRAAETEGAATTAETPPAAAEPTAGQTPTSGASEAAAPTSAGAPGGADAGGSTTAGAPGGPDTSAGVTGATGAATGAGTISGADTGAGAAEGAETTAGATSGAEAMPSSAPARTRRRLFRRRPKLPPAAAQPAPPVLLADPNVPAGVEPAEAPMRPPAGRRGRLRRRLRYLRRARELMLRDLGGLLYEIHRTGGGRVDAHATVVGAKVQRIAGLDAEAHALETALATPRGESIVFEPGIGGTCATCGQLYGSDARFCANCGTPIGAVPDTKPPAAEPEVVSQPERRAFWRRAARPAAPASPSDDTAVIDTAEPQDATAAQTHDQPVDPAARQPVDRDEPSGAGRRPDDEDSPTGDPASAQPHEQTIPDTAQRGEPATPVTDQTAAQPQERPAPEGAEPAPAAAERAGDDEGRGQADADEARIEGGDDDARAPQGDTDEPRAEGAAQAGTDESRAEGGPQAGTDEPRTEGGAPGNTDEPHAAQAGTDEARAEGAEPGNPHSGVRNGRPDEQQRPPGLSSSDPLVSRDRS